MTTRTQIRGHCQHCGGQQAIVRGNLAKHGYTVKHGWFEGVCGGHAAKPMEVDRSVTDAICAQVLADCAQLDAKIAKIEAGELNPTTCKLGSKRIEGKWVDMIVPFAEASHYAQETATNQLLWATKGRAKAGRQFAEDLKLLADLFHGEKLTEVRVRPSD